MTERRASPLQLCFFSTLHCYSNPGEACTQLSLVSKVVLVSSPSVITQDRHGSEEWWNVEQDCVDCDCACFTDDD